MEGDKIATYHEVGKITKEIAGAAEFNFDGCVYAAPGVIKHIKKRHKSGKDALSPQILNNILSTIKEIVSQPDYIGKHPDKTGTSIELVKKIDGNILVAIEVDLDSDYIYVSSMYPITESKINNRLNSGRFIKFTDIELGYVAVDKSDL